MALKVLMLRKKINDAKKALEALRAKDDEFATREKDLEKSIEEAASDEERSAVEEEIGSYETDKAAHEEEKGKLERQIEELEKDLAEEEKQQDTDSGHEEEREEKTEMSVRSKLFRNMNIAERTAMVEREDVKGWLSEVRACIKEKRALTNVGLTIPEVFLGFLRQNIENYSKLYPLVNVRQVSGTGREVIMGSIPEGIWTECCASLNELTIGFNDVEVDCFKVGGYFKVCNAILEDSDLDLADELLTAIGQAIGYALDKAILYGRNTSANAKMPLGIVSRLAQTSEPSGYPSTARAWVDYHSSHILTIANNVTGVDLFKAIMTDAAVISSKYARGEKTWVMNETTYTFLKVQAMSISASGAIVSGMENTMPVIGGKVVILDFVPNYVIIAGYMELYLLAERAGQKFAQSEHVFFLNDQTAFKGTARYDGIPVIAEAFAVIGVNGTSPDGTMTFAADNANSVQAIVLSQSSASIVKNNTLTLKAMTLPVDGVVTWASANTSKATVENGVVTGVAAGSAVITASCGDVSAVCNVTVTST